MSDVAGLVNIYIPLRFYVPIFHTIMRHKHVSRAKLVLPGIVGRGLSASKLDILCKRILNYRRSYATNFPYPTGLTLPIVDARCLFFDLGDAISIKLLCS